jgi:hypothetical protein
MKSVLENLVIQRARLTAQIKDLKNASAGHCEKQYVFRDDTHFPGQLLQQISEIDCIQRIYKEVAELNKGSRGGYFGDYYSYDEVFENSENEPCEHCRKVRENKKARTKLKIKLGQINGHITKIGIRLAKND